MTYSGNIRIFIFAGLQFLALFSGAKVAAQTQSDAPRPETTFIVTPRVNSAGHFPFSGALINNNVSFDVNIFYQRKMTGFFIFKSWDLGDAHSIVNYFPPGVFQKVNIGKKLNLGFFAGYIFSQTNGFSDDDSDFFVANVATWTLSEKIRVENTALFFNLSKAELTTTLANRLLISYFLEKWKFDIYVWERVEFGNRFAATSASLAVNFPKFKLSEKVYIQNTLSYQGFITEAKPSWAMRNGFLFSVSASITVD